MFDSCFVSVDIQGKLKTVCKWRQSRMYKFRQRTMLMTRLWKKWQDCC